MFIGNMPHSRKMSVFFREVFVVCLTSSYWQCCWLWPGFHVRPRDLVRHYRPGKFIFEMHKLMHAIMVYFQVFLKEPDFSLLWLNHSHLPSISQTPFVEGKLLLNPDILPKQTVDFLAPPGAFLPWFIASWNVFRNLADETCGMFRSIFMSTNPILYLKLPQCGNTIPFTDSGMTSLKPNGSNSKL